MLVATYTLLYCASCRIYECKMIYLLKEQHINISASNTCHLKLTSQNCGNGRSVRRQKLLIKSFLISFKHYMFNVKPTAFNVFFSVNTTQITNCYWSEESFLTLSGQRPNSWHNWDKSLKSLPPCYSQSPLLQIFSPPPSPPPPSKSGLKLVCNVNIVKEAILRSIALTLIRMTKDEKGLAFFKGLLL
jgi:hypothetical protein